MKRLDPSETRLEGHWTEANGKVEADATARRIEDLAEHHLKELKRDASGWLILFRDPDDGRLWELAYPKSEMHGGGPPTLRAITPKEAETLFGWRPTT